MVVPLIVSCYVAVSLPLYLVWSYLSTTSTMRVPVHVVTSASLVGASALHTTPQYFQTTPELYAGPTATGSPAFLAQTNPAPFPSVTYVPPQPLETQEPISGTPEHGNIFKNLGNLTPYHPNPHGFGVDEYPLPEGAKIVQLQMLSRHGARYPTAPFTTVSKLQNYSYTATGKLAFLNDWEYQLGENILVPIGKQELFDSGTLHQYQYGHLYPNDGSKIIARSTTQDRMTQSAEYFLAGFFGLTWTQNATLELIIEQDGFNNSLAGYYDCPNSEATQSQQGSVASEKWYNIYLKDAVKRINKLITFKDSSISLDASDVYTFQSLCAYETVSLGYSAFCQLFTYEEFQGYEYSIDVSFAGNDAFQSPTGRGVGIGWVQEVRARLQHHYVTKNTANTNKTLDQMPSTFPLDQSLYFDFSHDTNIMSILTAFGLKQFSKFLPYTHIVPRELIVSHLEPFGARLDIEIIAADAPVPAKRPTQAASPAESQARFSQRKADSSSAASSAGKTKYVHFLLNQRTIPLGRSLKECGERDDGWCELGDFLEATKSAYADSEFDFACFGKYPTVPYGEVSDGVPSKKQRTAGGRD